MKKYKYYMALIIAMIMSTCVVFAQAPVRRISNNNNSSTSRTNVATPPKGNVSNNPAPLNGYHEKNNTDGSVYKGNFKNDLYDGYGEIHFPNSIIYKGNFHEGVMQGHGTLIISKGNNYRIEASGEWKNGSKPNVWIVKIDVPGIYYEGSAREVSNAVLADGEIPFRPHGKGTMVWPDGSKYVGDFDADRGGQTGNGVYTTTDGYKYEGSFVNGLYHGKGVQTWKQDASKPTTECRFDGYFENGKRNGLGTSYFNNYEYQKRMWENGTMVKVTENGTWHW